MSRSDARPARPGDLGLEIDRVLALVDATVADGSAAALDPEAVRRLVAATVRLYYVRAGDEPGFAPGEDVVSPSEALTLAAGLLREHDVSTFDFALWLSRTGQM